MKFQRYGFRSKILNQFMKPSSFVQFKLSCWRFHPRILKLESLKPKILKGKRPKREKPKPIIIKRERLKPKLYKANIPKPMKPKVWGGGGEGRTKPPILNETEPPILLNQVNQKFKISVVRNQRTERGSRTLWKESKMFSLGDEQLYYQYIIGN